MCMYDYRIVEKFNRDYDYLIIKYIISNRITKNYSFPKIKKKINKNIHNVVIIRDSLDFRKNNVSR